MTTRTEKKCHCKAGLKRLLEYLDYKKSTMQRLCIKDLFNPYNYMQRTVFHTDDYE